MKARDDSEPLPGNLAPVPRSARQSGLTLAVKRGLDVAVAIVVLALAAPFLLVVALAIRVESPGPAIFRQVRVGRSGKAITVLKFRSMVADADPLVHREFILRQLGRESTQGTGTFKVEGDPRITRVGRHIRRLSIDELPQLVNVLRGDMSLVGPRPEVPYALEAYEPWQLERFSVLPGLTGPWQVSGRSRLSPAQMLELDVDYARRWSLGLDLQILARTPPALFKLHDSA